MSLENEPWTFGVSLPPKNEMTCVNILCKLKYSGALTLKNTWGAPQIVHQPRKGSTRAAGWGLSEDRKRHHVERVCQTCKPAAPTVVTQSRGPRKP